MTLNFVPPSRTTYRQTHYLRYRILILSNTGGDTHTTHNHIIYHCDWCGCHYSHRGRRWGFRAAAIFRQALQLTGCSHRRVGSFGRFFAVLVEVVAPIKRHLDLALRCGAAPIVLIVQALRAGTGVVIPETFGSNSWRIRKEWVAASGARRWSRW